MASILPKNLGKTRYYEGYRPLHPVLIIAGFRSSSLKVVESNLAKWIDQRVWLSVEKLNFLASGEHLFNMATKKKTDLDDVPKSEWLETKDLWCRHMALHPNGDGCSDPDGIKVRPIEGLDGIDYLAPGSRFTESFSFVFGPMIRVLKGVGYTKENMVAAPYDWRVPPMFLEQRDKFFSNLMVTIEKMVKRNQRKVVIMSHSMGYKTAHYFFMFVKYTIPNGQIWLDENIESFFAASPLFLGSSRALRGVLVGDKMGMDSFLTDEEAIYMARSWGSTPWLFPVGGEYWLNFRSYLFSRVEGIINIEVAEVLFPQQHDHDGYQVYANLYFGESVLSTTAREVKDDHSASWREQFQLVSLDPSKLTPDDVITIELRRKERGLASMFHRTIGSKTIRLSEFLDLSTKHKHKGWFELDVVNQNVLGTLTLGRQKEEVHPKVLLDLTWTEGSGTGERRLEASAQSEHGSVDIKVKFNGEMTDVNIDEKLLQSGNKEEIQRLIRQASSDAYQRLYQMTHHFMFQFEPRSMKDLIMDGARDSYIQFENYYLNDPLYGEERSLERPPVNKIKVVYGINVETETLYFFKRKNIRKRNEYDCAYELDPAGAIEGYNCKNGMAFETPQTVQTRADTGEKVQICGDGTVPYASLNFCSKWKNEPGVELDIQEIEGIRHRDILGDPRFHEIVIKYLCSPPTEETIGKEESPPNTENLEVEELMDNIHEKKEALSAKLSGASEDVGNFFAGKEDLPRTSMFADIPGLGARDRSATVQKVKNHAPEKPTEGQKLLASFHTSLDPSPHYDEYLKKHAAFVSHSRSSSSPQLRKNFSVADLVIEKGLEGVLRVRVKKATNLRKSDMLGLVDPYCVLKLGSIPNNTVKVARTEIAKASVNPVWNESFIIDLRNANFLEIKVKDWDRFSSDDTCGTALFDLRELERDVETSVSLDLDPQGTVTLVLLWSQE